MPKCKKEAMLKKFKFLFFVLFIEGAALMAVELMGAKLVAPFYGSSLYIWTAVLISTVLGLTLGYYAGGIVSQKKDPGRKLILILSVATVLVFVLPYTATALIQLTKGFSLIPGICFTSLLLILPLLLCFGTVGPLAVRLMSKGDETSGAIAGTVYFTSTLGGIVATFLFGYQLIPVDGLKFCAVITGLSLTAIPLIYVAGLFVKKKQAAPQSNTQKTTPTAAIKQNKIKPAIYLYAMLEGATVMAIELIAARMMAPYFGASLFVWAAVIGCTLSGLAMGYFAGGKLSRKYNPLVALQWALLAASVLLLLMHFTAQQLTVAFEGTNFETAIVLVSFLLVVPPLVCLGMIPTLLIRYITAESENVGSATGNVYALSSASGIVALIVFGFWIIPGFGLTMPAIITGIIVGLAPFIKLVSSKKYLSLLFIFFILLSFSVKKKIQSSPDLEIQHYSEGLLGQLMVADVTDSGTHTTDRMLFVNRIGETIVDKSTGAPRANYIIYVASVAGTLPEHSKALLLGLGGGSIAKLLHNNLNFDVDVAELDERVADVSRDYFSLNSEVRVSVDDARHYLEQTDKKYDVIFFDVFRGDIPPAHVLSVESFKKAATLLNKNGVIIVNFYGFLTGDLGKTARSVYKTLCASGLKTRILPTVGPEDERNLLFVAGNEPKDYSATRFPLTLFGKLVDMDTLFVENKTLGLSDAIVFTDDKPMLDLSVIQVANNCRVAYDSNYVQMFLKNGVPLFE